MVNASKLFCVSALVWLFLLMTLDGMSFPRAPRFQTMVRGVHVEPHRRSLASLAVTPQAKALVARTSTIKKMPHSVSSRDLAEHKVVASAASAQKPVAVAAAPMKVLAVHVDERTSESQSSSSAQPQQPAVSSKDAKQEVKVVQADEKRSTEQLVSVAKPNNTINFSSPEYLAQSLHDLLRMPTETVQGIEHLLASGLQERHLCIDTVRNDDGKTALHLAADHGDVLLAGVLLQAGATVSARDKNGLTSLHVAAQNGDADMVELLLVHGPEAAIIGADYAFGFTPLHVLLNNPALKSEAVNAVTSLFLQAMPGVISQVDSRFIMQL
jgi:hypothetical protein